MRWSVGIQADGDRVLTREEIVELADAVAAYGGIASGVGSDRYGAQLIVEGRLARGGDRGRLPQVPGGGGRGRAAPG